MNQLQTKFATLQNHTQENINGFLDGENYYTELSQKVFETFHGGEADEYTIYIKEARDILHEFGFKIVGGIFHVPYDGEVDSATSVALVRYINLAHKGRYFIVLGDEVLFVPECYRGVSKENIKVYIDLTVLEDSKRSSTNSKLINSLRGWIYGVRMNMSIAHH